MIGIDLLIGVYIAAHIIVLKAGRFGGGALASTRSITIGRFRGPVIG